MDTAADEGGTPLCRYSYCATSDYIKTRIVLVKKRREGGGIPVEVFADTYFEQKNLLGVGVGSAIWVFGKKFPNNSVIFLVRL